MGEPSQTSNYGWRKVLNGDLVMGKDLNAILDAIDDALYKAAHAPVPMSIFGLAGSDATIVGGAGAWVPLVPPTNTLTPPEIIFTEQATLKKFRLIISGNTSGSALDFSLALASAPLVPLTPVISVPIGGSIDTVVLASGVVDPNDTVLVIGKLNGAAGAPGNFDLEAIVSADLTE